MMNNMLWFDGDKRIRHADVAIKGKAADRGVLSESGFLDRLPADCITLFDGAGIFHSNMLFPYESTRYHLK